ncbi:MULTISPECIES: ABC transporter substrate-binding protein [Actinomyces]|uniref:ABC transporter substrate-binding protein n=1 Tax=Actinomyces respiraculi TaxID=2744574 RepID=A0A7T0PUQ5_9ACTO|nr:MULTISPECIES: ABC transporter substrate-binding protein [Actinomyces]QPL04431.1 ABC transporter substrate-binding protein [Actinomyces respiraculi]
MTRSLARSTLTRRSLLAAALVAGPAVMLASCSSGTASRGGTASAAADLVIGMTYTPNVQFAPFYMAANAGEYADGVSLRHHGAQEGQFDALLAGTEHLVVASADEAVVAASRGNDLVVVGGYYQRYPGSIIVPEDSTITALANLKGRRLGVPGRTGSTWFTVQLALETAGLSESDVDVQEIGFTQQAALVSGKVDAISGFTNNDAVQLAQNGLPVRTIDVAPQVPLVGASLVTTRALLDTRREDLAAAVTASVAGMELFVADPDGAVEATRAYVTDLVDGTQAARAREVANATAALVKPDADTVVGSLTSEHVGEMIDFLAGHGLLGETTPSTDEVCDPLS